MRTWYCVVIGLVFVLAVAMFMTWQVIRADEAPVQPALAESIHFAPVKVATTVIDGREQVPTSGATGTVRVQGRLW